MDRIKKWLIISAVSLCLPGTRAVPCSAANAETRLIPLRDENMLRGAAFTPAQMETGGSGVAGWKTGGSIINLNKSKTTSEYVSGYDCFKLDFFPGGVAFRFADTLPEGLKYISLIDSAGSFPPPASRYRLTGSVKLDKGTVTICGKTFSPAPDWRSFDIAVPFGLTKQFFPRLSIGIEPAMSISLRDFKLTPVYEATDDSRIALPGDRDLERIVLPADPSFQLKYNAMYWRGYLWMLSGKALPVYELAPGVKPGKTELTGSLLISDDLGMCRKKKRKKLKSGGYYLKIDADGGALFVRNPHTAKAAAVNYVRNLGVRLYAMDLFRLPEIDAHLALPAVNQVRNPRFAVLTQSPYTAAIAAPVLLNGGIPVAVETGYPTDMNWYGEPMGGSGHATELMIPYGKYHKAHPEYFVNKWKPGTVHFYNVICQTLPEVKAIVSERVRNWIRSVPDCDIVHVSQGDGINICKCDRCLASDPDPDGVSKTDRAMRFVNAVARDVAKELSGKSLRFLSYTQRYEEPPTEVMPEKNVVIEYCLWPSDFPWVHNVYSPYNEEGRRHVEEWSKLVGRDRLGFYVYSRRPLENIREAEFLNRYGNLNYYLCYGMGYGTLLSEYLVALWNWGEDLDTAMTEFCDAYYGPGGAEVARAFKVLDDYFQNYNYTSDYVRVYPAPSAIDPPTFERLCALFDAALDQADGNADYRNRILYEKVLISGVHINTHNRYECSSDEELETFGASMADFLRNCSELYDTSRIPSRALFFKKFWRSTPAQFLREIAGIHIDTPLGEDWTKDPAVLAFIEDPMKAIRALAPSVQQPIAGGWRIPASGLNGGSGEMLYDYECPPRHCTLLRRPAAGGKVSRIVAVLELEHAPAEGGAVLRVIGQDDDKEGRAFCKVLVNGREVFSGVNTFAERGWSTMTIPVPAKHLAAGRNRIEFVNTTPERGESKTKDSYNQGGAYAGQVRDYDFFWGWIALSEIEVVAAKAVKE